MKEIVKSKKYLFSLLIILFGMTAYTQTKPISGGWVHLGRHDSRYYQTFMQRITQLGMKYIVIQYVAFGGSVFYYSDIFPRRTGLPCDQLEALLSACDIYGLKVFIGTGFFGSNTDIPDIDASIKAMGEINRKYSNHNSFYGWYWSEEIFFTNQGLFELNHVETSKQLSQAARQLTPNAKIMTAPYKTRYASADNSGALALQLSQMGVDIVAYQDEVGVHWATPAQTAVSFSDLRKAHDLAPQVALWADIEIFDYTPPSIPFNCPVDNFYGRVQNQLESVSPSADVILVYEINPKVVGLGTKSQSQFCKQYTDALKNKFDGNYSKRFKKKKVLKEVQAHKVNLNLQTTAKSVDWPVKNKYFVKGKSNLFEKNPKEGLQWNGIKDCSYAFSIGYNDEFLCLNINVMDDFYCQEKTGENIWENDCVEIYLNTDIKGQNKNDIFHILLSANSKNINEKYSVVVNFRNTQVNVKSIFTDMILNENGYTLLSLIPWKVLNNYHPVKGSSIGFNIAVDDADKDKERKYQMAWIDSTLSYKDPSTFGKLVFK